METSETPGTEREQTANGVHENRAARSKELPRRRGSLRGTTNKRKLRNCRRSLRELAD